MLQSLTSKELVLSNNDVLTIIFAYFTPRMELAPSTTDKDTERLLKEGRKELYNFALVCKDFSDPALDCLWAHLDSLTPLLKIHPAMQTIGERFYYFQKSTLGTSRFHAYAKRIRSISLKSGDGVVTHPVSLAGMAWLGQQCHDSPLTPGLRQMSFEDPNADSVHMGLLPLIVSPTLERVEFKGSFQSSEVFATYALPLVCAKATSLRSLSLKDEGSRVDATIWEQLPAVLKDLQLETLDIQFPNDTSLPSNFIARLGNAVETLTSLTLDIHTKSHGPSADVLGRSLLPNVAALHLKNRDDFDLCECYPPFLLNKATKITFHLSDVQEILEGDEFSRAIETLSGVSTLAEIELIHDPVDADCYFTDNALEPFLQSLNLTRLAVSGDLICFGFDNGGIKLLIDAAFSPSKTKDPKQRRVLRSLSIPLQASGDDVNEQDLGSLVHVANVAVGLERVSLSIRSDILPKDAETLMSFTKAFQPVKQASTLRQLELSDSRPKDKDFGPAECLHLARFLDKIFPNLDILVPVNQPFRKNNWEEHWGVIEQQRRMLKAMRLGGIHQW